MPSFGRIPFLVVLLAVAWAGKDDLIDPSPQYLLSLSEALPVLENFQVYEPVLSPNGSSNRYGGIFTETLMEHDFAFSYQKPFVGSYRPPPCSFNRITMNFTVTSKGRQFDRLAIMYLGDFEVWRTSTAEPTANGIVWTYTKEMQQYLSLWTSPQTIVFDLGNLVDETYTGIYHTTLTATFSTISNPASTADVILPISNRQGSLGQGSVFSIPDHVALVAHTLPRNVQRAVVSISATGQINEEFWYTNVFDSEVDTFAASNTGFLGGGPFREVQLMIDGQPAGFVWPFPVIFTGGIVPGIWRPIAGIDTFDLREHEIDITPWLPLLLDGKSHTFEIKVASLTDDGKHHAKLEETRGQYWLVTGKIFLFLDLSGFPTFGTTPMISMPDLELSISSQVTTNSSGANETLTYSTLAKRYFSVSSIITTSHGTSEASWTQDLSFSNTGVILEQGIVQHASQSTVGRDHSSSGYVNSYQYPLAVNTTFHIYPRKEISIIGSLDYGLHSQVYGPSVFPSGIQTFNATDTAMLSDLLPSTALEESSTLVGALLDTNLRATAEYYASSAGSMSFGTTEQDFAFKGLRLASEPLTATSEFYTRHVKAVNSSIMEDQQKLVGHTYPSLAQSGPVQSSSGVGRGSIRAILGRGPR